MHTAFQPQIISAVTLADSWGFPDGLAVSGRSPSQIDKHDRILRAWVPVPSSKRFLEDHQHDGEKTLVVAQPSPAPGRARLSGRDEVRETLVSATAIFIFSTTQLWVL
ncbi:hypothetical protein RRG08_022497 [Elysia crispata]|uniref:Uncharacterized protein n=1 Tax=Elysia crispata TaxID=231223 RepID=A0AAE0Z1B5_9GAST|nr:hypothetical protein RRG08_022497 [Elysia crispata]